MLSFQDSLHAEDPGDKGLGSHLALRPGFGVRFRACKTRTRRVWGLQLRVSSSEFWALGLWFTARFALGHGLRIFGWVVRMASGMIREP